MTLVQSEPTVNRCLFQGPSFYPERARILQNLIPSPYTLEAHRGNLDHTLNVPRNLGQEMPTTCTKRVGDITGLELAFGL